MPNSVTVVTFFQHVHVKIRLFQELVDEVFKFLSSGSWSCSLSSKTSLICRRKSLFLSVVIRTFPDRAVLKNVALRPS